MATEQADSVRVRWARSASVAAPRVLDK